ncbi:MAG: hypothetical protein J6N73_06845 [Prevotella sp.]|nr:hypothetical protein [Prevotella sp.]
MKKLFTLILMALAIVTGAKAQGTQLILGGQGENEEHSWGWNRPISTDETIYFDQAWGEFWLAQNLNGAKKYRLTVKETNSKINLRINNSETTTNDDKNQYKAITSKVMEGELTSTDTGIELQATEAGQIIHVVSFVLIDESGKEEQTSYATNWGTSFVGGQYTSTGQWAELYMKSVAGRETQQIQINFGEAVESGKLHLKAYYTDDTEGYFDISGTTAKITLGKAVKAVSLQAKTSDVVTLKINSVYTYEIPSFSAVTISSTLSGTNENIPVVANGEELFADLSDEATNEFVINSITITPVGSFQRVQGQFRLTSEDGNTQIEPKSGGFETVPFTYDSTDDVWKAEDLKLEVAGGDLDANTNYILEFYFEGSTDGNTYDYTYKNGENNFKVKFQNGTPAVQFKDTETADVVFKVDGTEKTVTINKDGSVFSNNANLGELSDLKVKGFQIKGYNHVELTSGYCNLQAIIQETANAENINTEIGGMRSKDGDLTVFSSTSNFFIKTTLEDIDIIKSAKEAGLTLKHNTQYTMKFYYGAVFNDKHYFVPNKDNGEYAEVTFTYTDKITGVEITLNTPTAGTYETHDLLEDGVNPVNIGPAEVFKITNLDVATAGLAITGVKLRYITHDNGVPDNQIKEIALTNNYGTWSLDDEMNVFDEIGAQPMHKYKIEYWIEASVEGDSETLKWNNGGENYIVGVEVDDGTSGFKETSITVTTADTPETIELTDDMTTPMSYNDVEKFVVNNITTTTYGNVSGVKLCYRIYTNGSWDGISTFNLPLTDDGFGTWQTLGSHDFVDDHNWTPGINYTIVFWFEGYDETNNETIKWDNSGNRYEVDITVKDTSTGINGIEGDEADAKADAYNIAGQKVGKNYKGLVIKNGKKTVVK